MISLKHIPKIFRVPHKRDRGYEHESDSRTDQREWTADGRWVVTRIFEVLMFTVFVTVLMPSSAFAATNVGMNVGNLLKQYAGEVYGGIVAAFSLVFLWNRRYIELATFLFAAVVVAWMVFAPDQIGKAAEAIGKQIFG